MRARFDYTQTERSLIVGAVGAGTIAGTLPMNFLFFHFGGRFTFFAAGMISALSTLSIPSAAYWNLYAFLVVRFLQVVSLSPNDPLRGLPTLPTLRRWA